MIAQRMRELDIILWQHARLVARTTDRLAHCFQLSDRERSQLLDAAWLHDIGKLTIPNAILNKPAALDSAEWAIVRAHPETAAAYLSNVPSMQDIAPIVRHHHERFDGAGYPDRLAAYAIPSAARIICVVDAFEAMTTERPYRNALSFEAALKELQRCSGTQFDPTVVQAFVDIAPELKQVTPA